MLGSFLKFVCRSCLGKQFTIDLAKKMLESYDLKPSDYLSFAKARYRLSDHDVFRAAYQVANIDDFGDETHTGESYLMKEVLPKYFDVERMTVFDIGANSGKYTALLSNTWPNATIYSFEPNPDVYSSLARCNSASVKTFPIGFGSIQQPRKLYTYQDTTGSSEHGSLLEGVFTNLHREQELASHEIQIDTLDHFCSENSIHQIDFLKIDTEGFEYEVLKGGSALLSQDKIGIIQLEFNEMNIVSRVFLLDFFELLGEKFDFFRLQKNALHPMRIYSSYDEVFRYQNLVLINKSLS